MGILGRFGGNFKSAFVGKRDKRSGRDRVLAIRRCRSRARFAIGDENTSLGRDTSSRRAGTRALPPLFSLPPVIPGDIVKSLTGPTSYAESETNACRT